MSPERVPIIKPGNGVKPIEVSIDSPPLIAQIDEPLPMCAQMMFKSDSGLFNNSAVLIAIKRCDVPWKP